jgi:hypothetical protein
VNCFVSGSSTVTGAKLDVDGGTSTVGVTYAASTTLSPGSRMPLLPRGSGRPHGTAWGEQLRLARNHPAAKQPATPQQACSLTPRRVVAIVGYSPRDASISPAPSSEQVHPRTRAGRRDRSRR